MSNERSLDRRDFLQGAAAGALGVAAGAATASILPAYADEDEEELEEEAADEASEEEASTDSDSDSETDWDYEADFVVVGSGTACMGAFAAAQSGASVIVIEKNSWLGGTTKLSGCVCWVPGNHVMDEFGYGPDVSDEEVVEYLRAADVTHAGEEALQLDYVENAKTVLQWMDDNFDFEMGIFPSTCDYYDLPGAMGLGRSVGFADSVVDTSEVGMDEPYGEVFEPLFDELGCQVFTDTEASSLICDDDGRVIGVQTADGLAFKADKGVLLGTGGFEHNEDMRNRYLAGPLLGISSPEANTGDGILMARKLGADIGNMSSIWGVPYYLTNEEGPDGNILGDYGMYVGLPGAIYVNTKGRRFVNECAGYDVVTNAMYNYDTLSYSQGNLISYMIFDQAHVDSYGWPGFGDRPDYVAEFDSLEELAEEYGIDEEGLLDEVERFNEMAETGVDTDFGRGSWLHDTIQCEYSGAPTDTPNCSLGAISTPPYYAVKVGPGAFGTNGGLRTDVDSRVLDLDGEPIEGLYACGNCTEGVFGSIYPGPGGTVGPGFYKAVRAANHALDLGIV